MLFFRNFQYQRRRCRRRQIVVDMFVKYDNKRCFIIWDCTPDAAKYIAKHEIGVEGDIPQAVIDAVLSEKCFDGKSSMEIEQEITVTVMYEPHRKRPHARFYPLVWSLIVVPSERKPVKN